MCEVFDCFKCENPCSDFLDWLNDDETSDRDAGRFDREVMIGLGYYDFDGRYHQYLEFD